MIALGANHYQSVLLAGFTALAILLCIDPPFPRDEWLQQIPTVIAIVALPLISRRAPLSNWAFSLTILFLCLHVVGARYIYSFVPYDEWCSRFLGFEVTRTLGFHRNHYDRLVHFAFGLLMVWPTRELVTLAVRSSAWSWFFALAVITAAAAVYELLEWLAALTFAPDWADRYLGQQGDPWDAHWDMALAVIGAALSMAIAQSAERLSRRA
jgi:putative membrane protein